EPILRTFCVPISVSIARSTSFAGSMSFNFSFNTSSESYLSIAYCTRISLSLMERLFAILPGHQRQDISNNKVSSSYLAQSHCKSSSSKCGHCRLEQATRPICQKLFSCGRDTIPDVGMRYPTPHCDSHSLMPWWNTAHDRGIQGRSTTDPAVCHEKNVINN